MIILYQKCKYIIDKDNRVRAFMLGITHGEAVCLCYIFLKYAYEKLIQISIKQNRVICIKNINDSYKTNRIRVRAFMLGLSRAKPVLLKYYF